MGPSGRLRKLASASGRGSGALWDTGVALGDFSGRLLTPWWASAPQFQACPFRTGGAAFILPDRALLRYFLSADGLWSPPVSRRRLPHAEHPGRRLRSRRAPRGAPWTGHGAPPPPTPLSPSPLQATVLLRSDPSVICPEKYTLFGNPYYLPLSTPTELLFPSVR